MKGEQCHGPSDLARVHVALSAVCRATVQNCVLSHHVQVGEGATLRDCYVGPQFAIPQGSGC